MSLVVLNYEIKLNPANMLFVLLHLSAWTLVDVVLAAQDTTAIFGSYRLEAHKLSQTYAKAKKTCEARNSWLIQIKNEELGDYLKTFAKSHNMNTWIGAKSTYAGWKWNDGTDMEYTNWDGRVAKNRECPFFKSENGTWIGKNCSAKRYFVCQSDANNIIFYNNFEFYFDHITKRNQSESKENCEEMGSELVSIKDSKTRDILAKELDVRHTTSNRDAALAIRYYISLTDEEVEQKWIWVDGTSLESTRYNNWYRDEWGEGLQNRETNCVVMIKFMNWQWADVGCYAKDLSVCQKELKFHKIKNCEYLINHLGNRTYYDAQSYCFRMDNRSGLAMIKTSEIHDSITNKLKSLVGSNNNVKLWTGAKKRDKQWEFLDNTAISEGGINKWGSNQPGDGNKLFLGSDEQTTWTDLQWFSGTTEQMHGFICEVPVNDPCNSAQCMNQGKCFGVGCHWICQCNNGYRGLRCENDMLAINLTQSEKIILSGESVTFTLNVLTEVGEVEINLYKEKNADYLEKKSVNNGSVTFNITPSSTGEHIYKFLAKGTGTTRVINATIVVHSEANITSVSPVNILVPSTPDANKINCSATGFPIPKIVWYFGKDLVSKNPKDNVYQLDSFGMSILQLRKADKSNAGVYTCQVKNYVGASNTEVFKSINAKVLSMPEYRVTGSNCSSDIEVKWNPGVEATNIKHRIEYSESQSSLEKRYVDVIATDSESQSTIVTNLTDLTSYVVKMSICLEICFPATRDEANVKTGIGRPGAVEDVLLTGNVGDKLCNVNWSKHVPSEYITGYRVTAQVSLHNIVPGTLGVMASNKTFDVSFNNVQHYTFKTIPNRKYIVFLQAKTCAGTGVTSQALGNCISNVGAPDVVPLPNISDIGTNDNTRNIVFQPIDQTNGAISCFFVIVENLIQNQDGYSTVEFSMKDLKKAETFSKLTSSQEGKKYIAVASSNIPMKPMTITIGDGETSSCDINNLKQGRKRKKREISKIISAKNFPLETGNTYSYFIVTSTPGEDGNVVIGSSAVNKFEILESSSTLLIAVVVASTVFFIIVIVFVVLFIRFKRRRKSPDKGNDTSVSASYAPTSYDQTNEYVNVGVGIIENTSETRITGEMLHTEYNKMRSSNNAGFRAQFDKLKEEMKIIVASTPTTVASRLTLKKKNRYKNILPYDSSRVVLSGEEDENYINACYIHGYNLPKKYIATQGPLPATVNDFWRMVTEHTSTVIVMLTGLVEKGKKKCEKYWPDLGRRATYGQIALKTVDETHVGSYIKRMLEITSNGKMQFIHHFQFTSWPDHGVPVATSDLFRFHKAVTRIKTQKPIVVHCSAGAGRTGAYISYDYLTQQIQNENGVDVYNCVLKMREQRIDMVQTMDQYVFVHKLLVEAQLFGDTDMDESKLRQIMKNNMSNHISIEFGNLSSVPPMNEKRIRNEEINISMDRKQKVLPYERNKIIIVRKPGETATPYYNASVMKSDKEENKIIAAQGPITSTSEYFWRVVMDHNAAVIFMLTPVEEGSKDQCAQYWPKVIGSKLQFDDITVELTEETEQNSIVTRKFHATRERQTISVVQHQHTEWNVDKSSDISKILELVSMFQEYSNLVKLVHCSDGAGRTGVFLTLINLIQRVKVEDRVDVFRAVKDLRDCRPGMVQTEAQYRFCYEAILTYIDSCNLYENTSARHPIEVDDTKNDVYENWTIVRENKS